MNDRPERDEDELGLSPDDNEIDEEDFDPEALLDSEDDIVDDLDDLDEDDDAYLAPDEDDDEVIEIPEQYAAVPAVPPAFAAQSEREETPAAELSDDEAEPESEELEAEEEQVPRRSPFDEGGPFAAPPRSRARQQRRAMPSLDAAPAAQPSVFTTFKPESNFGAMVGLGVTGACLIIGILLVLKSFSHDPSLTQFWTLLGGAVLLTLAGLAAYWTWGALTLRYVVDRNALTIHWGAQRQVVPLANIERLIPADPDGDAPDVQGVDWPGHHIGRGRIPQLGEVLFYSGHRRTADVLYVQTASHTYGISVPDAVAFAQTIQSNQLRGPLFEARQTVQRNGIAAQSFWLDPQARFLTFVLLATFAVVVGYVLNSYPGLAQSIPLPYPALGGLVRVADKSELLDIPRSAAVFLGLNLVLAVVLHPWERMVSIVLLLAGIALQVTLLVASIVALT